MQKDRPPFRAYKQRNRHATADFRKLRSPLAVRHRINRTPPVELMASFAQPKERTRAAGKCDSTCASINLKFLDDFSSFVLELDADRVTRDADTEVGAGSHLSRRLGPQSRGRRRPLVSDQNQIVFNLLCCVAGPQGKNCKADRVRRNQFQRELDGPTSHKDRTVFDGLAGGLIRKCQAKTFRARHGPGGGKASESLAARDSFAHVGAIQTDLRDTHALLRLRDNGGHHVPVAVEGIIDDRDRRNLMFAQAQGVTIELAEP